MRPLKIKIINEYIKNAKNPTKIPGYIYSVSIASCAHTAQGDLLIYYEVREDNDFMEEWFKGVLKQDKIVEKDNGYTDVGDDSNLSNDVVMFGHGSSNFDLNCFLPILQNTPDLLIVFIIQKHTHFKIIKVKSVDGITLKFLDTVNFIVS
jgi:hypothetical protein